MKRLVLIDVTLAVMVPVDAARPASEASDKVLELMQTLTYGADTSSSILDYSFGSETVKGEVDPDRYEEGDVFE